MKIILSNREAVEALQTFFSAKHGDHVDVEIDTNTGNKLSFVEALNFAMRNFRYASDEKIRAIKALRTLYPSIGLRVAKDSIEFPEQAVIYYNRFGKVDDYFVAKR